MTRKTRSHTGVTRYLQLYTVLSQALADGSIAPGALLPSEPELVRRYQVSRTTVRRALARLEEENRIVRRRGSGTYARDGTRRRSLHVRSTSLIADLREVAERTTSRLLAFEAVATPELVRRAAPDFGARALLIRRIRHFDGAPSVLATAYLPERFASKLTARKLGNSAVLVALRELGAGPARGEQVTTAVAADAQAARALKVAIGSPLLHVRRVVQDRRDRVIAYQDFLFRPESYELRTEIEIR